MMKRVKVFENLTRSFYAAQGFRRNLLQLRFSRFTINRATHAAPHAGGRIAVHERREKARRKR
jgi:hypothetical protein